MWGYPKAEPGPQLWEKRESRCRKAKLSVLRRVSPSFCHGQQHSHAFVRGKVLFLLQLQPLHPHPALQPRCSPSSLVTVHGALEDATSPSLLPPPQPHSYQHSTQHCRGSWDVFIIEDCGITGTGSGTDRLRTIGTCLQVKGTNCWVHYYIM